MPFSLLDGLMADVAPWFLAWGPPVVYLLLCVIANRTAARRRIPVPNNLPPTPAPPDLHPVLLGALVNHSDSNVTNIENACEVAFAAIVRLVGRGGATFEERGHAERPLSETEENTGPVAESGRRRHRRSRRTTIADRLIHAYGSHLWITVTNREPERHDRDALELVMPPDARSASVEDLYARMWHASSYDPLRHFLGSYDDELCEAGLATRPNPLLQLVFAPLISFALSAWCVLGPMVAVPEPDTRLVPAAIVLFLTVMICRAILVDLGLRLTPEGARVLGTVDANVRWVEAALHEGPSAFHDLGGAQTADLLAALVAVGCHELAADLADCLVASGDMDGGEGSAASQAARLCMRRRYVDASTMRRDATVLDLLLKQVRDLERRLS